MDAARRLLPPIIALLACGCAPQADDLLADYRARVQRAAGAHAGNPVYPDVPAYPSHRDRAVAIPEVRGSVWELLFDLPDCELDHLVSERNSILGRYWPATSRFDYELRFRLRLDRCRARLGRQEPADEEQREFLARLDEIDAAKRDVLPAVWWALSYDSPEFEQAFSPAASPLPPEAPGRRQAALAALEHLQGLSALLDAPADGLALAPLERALQQLAQSRYGGGLLRSLALLTGELDATSTALEHAAAAAVCPQNRPTPRGRVLHRVFNRYYAGKVQPYFAEVQRGGRAWLDAHARLLDRQRVAWPPAFERFRGRALDDGPDSLWQRWSAARVRHVEAWQRVLRQCALMPGTDTREP